ncbi:hypothetical protein VNO80_33851 [Phaseolus coccineus]|uniref:Uncharacterized protein n=1 Tax=Phaseolus coccineus TaxID=3886 RepID=A0AAN9KQI5_PHACN
MGLAVADEMIRLNRVMRELEMKEGKALLFTQVRFHRRLESSSYIDILLEADFRKERGRENPLEKAVNGFSPSWSFDQSSYLIWIDSKKQPDALRL